MDQDPGVDGFAAYLKQAIDDAGFTTPSQFAKRVPGPTKTDPSVVLRWLSGEARPSIKLLERIAPVLGKSVEDLVGAAYPAATKGAAKMKAPSRRELHPLADELDKMLNPNSPLDDDMRQRVIVVVDAGMAPARKQMRRRRPAS